MFMKINSKILIFTMLVMMICCVTAVSATDTNGTDDTVITDEIAVDDVSEIVEDVEIDESTDSADDSPATTSKVVTVTDTDYGKCFDSNGYLNDTAVTELTFSGNFSAKSFGNFKINKTIPLNVAGATFNDVSFDLLADNLVLDGARFVYNTNGAVVYVNSDNDVVQNLNIVVNTPSTADTFAIRVEEASNVQILSNVITYTALTANPSCYNHVIRVEGGKNVTVSRNNITAYLPLKEVDFLQPYPSIYTDKVAGVAVESSEDFVFTNNRLLVNVSCNNTDYPTLDAFIIANSVNAYIAGNTIIEIDNETRPGNNNYLYAIDVYACNGTVIERNNIKLHSEGGTIIPGTNNGTGAAYGIQLTGPHSVTIHNNTIDTANNGPNCGIYSQNFNGDSFLNITNNIIYVEGNASSDHQWSLVTGMELQDNEGYIAGNTITVYNKETYADGDNVYGISFSQYGNGIPTFEITNNTVEVIHGKYAVYIQYSQDSSVYENCLYTDYYCGDAAVFDPGDIWIYGNYCPNCNCVNCNCTH